MRLKLSNRLYASLGVAALAIVASVAATSVQIKALAQLEQESDRSDEILRKADLMLFNQAYALASYRGFVLERNERFAGAFREAASTDERHYQELRDALKDDPQSITRLEKLQGIFKRWEAKAEITLEELGRTRAAVAPQSNTHAGFSIRDEVLPAFQDFITREREKLTTHHTQALSARENAMRYAILGALLALAMGTGLLAWTIRMVRRELEGAIGTASSSSSEISASLTQQERSLAEQASSLNEVASTLGELNTTTTQAAQNGEAISHRSAEASAAARHWGDMVRGSLEEMSGLKDKVDSIARQILELSEQTGQIGLILGSVSEIASQTNLLALNAAVEAARAGEHGRGFAVVATEIRKLADQSKKALERIGALVTQIQKATNATVMAAEEGSKRVDATLRQAGESGSAIQSLLNTLEETVVNTQQIVFTLRQQTLGVGQINEAVSGLNLGMKETVSGINQVKLGLQSLGDMTRDLKALV